MSDIGKRCRLGSVEECVWGLESCPICVGNLEAMQVVQLSAVASSQWEEEGLLVFLPLADGINTTVYIQPALPL